MTLYFQLISLKLAAGVNDKFKNSPLFFIIYSFESFSPPAIYNVFFHSCLSDATILADFINAIVSMVTTLRLISKISKTSNTLINPLKIFSSGPITICHCHLYIPIFIISLARSGYLSQLFGKLFERFFFFYLNYWFSRLS